jgi:hypothetical protein
MNELIAVQKIAGWEKLKALVLDSVSSPITKRVYNMALNEFLAWFQQAPQPGFTKGDRKRVEGVAGGPPPRLVVDHHPHVGDSQAGRGSRRQRPAGARVGGRHFAREERKNAGHTHRQLAVTAPMPTWAKVAVDAWASPAGVVEGYVFRPVNRAHRVTGEALGEKVVWQLIKPYADAAGVPGIAPHDLRRTCAKLCRAGGGELEQIQLLLGHASVQTTERYLGTKQDLVHAPNDAIKLKVML